MKQFPLLRSEKRHFPAGKRLRIGRLVYLVSRVPQFPAGKNNNVRGTKKAGSIDTYNPSVVWEHRLNKTVNTSLNAEYLLPPGKYKFHLHQKMVTIRPLSCKTAMYTDPREPAFFGRSLREKKWKAKAYFYHSERGYPRLCQGRTRTVQKSDRQWDTNFFLQSLSKRTSDSGTACCSAENMRTTTPFLSDPRSMKPPCILTTTTDSRKSIFHSANQFAFSPSGT
jgi:hypothetical protein